MAEQVGNGSREKLLEYFSGVDGSGQRTIDRTDHLLAWLWTQGFRVVPHPVARRAKKYTGPMTAGSTHTARLAKSA